MSAHNSTLRLDRGLSLLQVLCGIGNVTLLTASELYAVNLERTVLELQRKIEEHEIALTQVSSAG